MEIEGRGILDKEPLMPPGGNRPLRWALEKFVSGMESFICWCKDVLRGPRKDEEEDETWDGI